MTPTEMTFTTRDCTDDLREVTYHANLPSIAIGFSSDGSSCSFDIADLDWLRACLEKIAQEREVR
jgi:hypothetical protein